MSEKLEEDFPEEAPPPAPEEAPPEEAPDADGAPVPPPPDVVDVVFGAIARIERRLDALEELVTKPDVDPLTEGFNRHREAARQRTED